MALRISVREWIMFQTFLDFSILTVMSSLLC